MYNKKKQTKDRSLYQDIGNRLLIKRRELHYTQEQMAEILGVSAGFYGMVERGEKAPSIEKLVLIYKVLGIDITYLLTGDDNDTQVLDFLMQCPQEKRYDFEQLMKYAMNLADVKYPKTLRFSGHEALRSERNKKPDTDD